MKILTWIEKQTCMYVQMPKHINFACLALALLDVKLVFTVSVIDDL